MCTIQKPKSNLMYLSVRKPWQWKADEEGPWARLLSVYLKVTCDFPLKFQTARNISKPSCGQRQQSDIISLQGTVSEAPGMVALKNRYHEFWFLPGMLQPHSWTMLGQRMYDENKLDQSFPLKTPRKVLLTFAARKNHLGSSCFTPRDLYSLGRKWTSSSLLLSDFPSEWRTLQVVTHTKEFLCPELWTF